MNISPDELARRIEHTLLKPEATGAQIDALCDQAIEFGFHAVCVNQFHVARAAGRLSCAKPTADSGRVPVVVSVAGFPLGANLTVVKAEEARRAIGDGAAEIDMVARLGSLIVGDDDTFLKDIEAVAGEVHGGRRGGLLKVILETRALGREQIISGCRLCADAGADFVKTSTGFHQAGGATVEHVRLLCHAARGLGVKAAGGIRDESSAIAMIEAGAARIGTSSGVAIMDSFRSHP